jgi:hypothetical protein
VILTQCHYDTANRYYVDKINRNFEHHGSVRRGMEDERNLGRSPGLFPRWSPPDGPARTGPPPLQGINGYWSGHTAGAGPRRTHGHAAFRRGAPQQQDGASAGRLPGSRGARSASGQRRADLSAGRYRLTVHRAHIRGCSRRRSAGFVAQRRELRREIGGLQLLP